MAMKADNAASIDATSAKRKHTGDKLLSNGILTLSHGQQQNDILEVLRQNDLAQDFLDYEFKSTPEHTTKRAKLSNGVVPTSIATKLAKSAYHSLEDLARDAATVGDAIIAETRAKDRDNEQDGDRPDIGALKKVQRAKMMRQAVEDLVRRESRVDLASAVKIENAGEPPIEAEHADEIGTVLTLFGNAPGPKQLFSSFQNASTTSDGRAVRPALAIEELNLPNGLTTTKIKPLASTTAEKPVTFADAFPPAFSLPALSAPKPARRPSTRDNTMLWEFKDNTRGVKRGGYTTQTLTTADWLSYGGTLSTMEKRKMRDRALSNGGEGEDLAVELEQQEESLFRQAYSSYAPAYDNSRSVVDVSLKNLVWWHKVGSKKYNARFNLDPALREYDASTDAAKDDAIDDSGFAQAVEDYEEESEVAAETKDLTKVDAVLEKITSLIETLASMQVIRNARGPGSTISKTPISPAPSSIHLTEVDVPSKHEVETYEQLQREIAYLVLQLPPYAVAKLNGSQLADLGVSRVITFESKAYRGQMEEDAAARIARQTAAATAAGVASLNRAASNTNPHYSGSSRTPAIGQSANTHYGTNTGYGSRTPMTAPAQHRPLSSQQSYGTPTAPNRQYTPSTTQYARSGAPQMNYAPTNGQYQQRPSQGYGYNASLAQTPGQRPVQPAGQPLQRSHMAAANAVSYQTTPQASYAPQASPPKQLAPDTGRGTPINYAPSGQTPVNGIRAPPPLMARVASGTPQPDANGHA